jgi:hypothetical protein
MEYELFKKEMKEIKKDYLLLKIDLKTFFKAFAEKLDKNEKLKEVFMADYKMMKYLVSLTDKRIVLLSKPLIGSLKFIELPLDKVKSVSMKKGFFTSGLIIDAGETYTLKSVYKGDAESFISLFESLEKVN